MYNCTVCLASFTKEMHVMQLKLIDSFKYYSFKKTHRKTYKLFDKLPGERLAIHSVSPLDQAFLYKVQFSCSLPFSRDRSKLNFSSEIATSSFSETQFQITVPSLTILYSKHNQHMNF